MADKTDREKAADIVRDAGGEIVGRTRLQKVACLLELAGFGAGFQFEYHYYGPYCEELAEGIRMAHAFGEVTEEEKQASWGGRYSVFTASPDLGQPVDADRAAFAAAAAGIDSIELELATTAAYLSAVEGCQDPWSETARRKPEKAEGGRLDKAKDAYRQLLACRTRTPLPRIV